LLVPDDNYGLLNGEPTPAENGYLLRPSAGRVFEIVRLLEDVDEIPTVERFSTGFLPKRSSTDAT
jgi:hypothetical protein